MSELSSRGQRQWSLMMMRHHDREMMTMMLIEQYFLLVSHDDGDEKGIHAMIVVYSSRGCRFDSCSDQRDHPLKYFLDNYSQILMVKMDQRDHPHELSSFCCTIIIIIIVANQQKNIAQSTSSFVNALMVHHQRPPPGKNNYASTNIISRWPSGQLWRGRSRPQTLCASATLFFFHLSLSSSSSATTIFVRK